MLKLDPKSKHSLRTYIMYDALAQRPPFEGYKSFCKVIGDENYDYVDYEIQYYRFLHGNLDFSYDQSLNPVHPKLTDLPNEILVKVVEKLDVKSRLATQKVSRKLRQIRARNPAEIQNFTMKVTEDHKIELEIEGKTVVYSKSAGDEDHCSVEYGNSKKSQIAENYSKLALADMARILGPVNTRIDTLWIKLEYYDAVEYQNRLEHFQDMVIKTEDRLCVRNVHFEVESGDICLQFLAFFEPKVLESFSFNVQPDSLNLQLLMEMEQFKMVKKVDLNLEGILALSDLEKFRNFENFSLAIELIDAAGIRRIRDWLVGSAHFQSCVIDVINDIDVDEVSAAIQESNEVLEFAISIRNNSISVKRK